MPRPRHREYPGVTVDVVVIAWQQGQPQVLLIKRKNAPFKEHWALPGGFVEPYEPLEAAARRELWEETGIEPAHLEQLHTFGDPGRDPRGWTISVVYLALLDPGEADALHPWAGSDAGDVGWFDLVDPPPLAFDHSEILACAAGQVREAKGVQRVSTRS